MSKTKQPKITIRLDKLAWKNFPDYTNGAIERHLEHNEPQSKVWGIITKTDGTAGFLMDLAEPDLLAAVTVLNNILNIEAEAW